MTPEQIAKIAYAIVHDFQIQVVLDARAEIKHDMEYDYRNMVESILMWATAETFSTIARHAKNTLEFIDAETFDELEDC